MNLREKLEKGIFVKTLEVSPPKGTDLSSLIKKLQPFEGKIDAINITDGQSAVMKLGAVATSYILEKEGFETICQITCRDRNRIALQQELLSMSVLGIKNVLILTGDHPSAGDHPQAKPVFDLNSIELIEVAKRLNEGFDMVGKKLNKPTDLFIGAAFNPNASSPERELQRLKIKIEKGANFFQSQGFFEPQKFIEFYKKARRFQKPLIAGILFLKSFKTAKFISEKVSGVDVPKELIERLRKATDERQEAIKIAKELILQVKELVQGVHFMFLGDFEGILEILEDLNL